jgi:type II restriction/modification system DNA methylase subunit YeeA
VTPQEFIAKWQNAALSERSAYQQHFLDLCELLGQPKPAAADPSGAFYCFERGVSKTEGGKGWADVWLRGYFGWEYKGKHKDLKAAYSQLLQYRESLENPPLLVVCDLNRFEVHTNFTGTAKRVYAFDLAGLGEPKNLEVLRRLFTEPDSLRPGQTSQSVTEQVAEQFGRLSDGMSARGVEAHDAAHFLMKLMFCMFAEDIELLRGKVFSRALAGCKDEPVKLAKVLENLFQAMAKGGMFGADEILYFNGGLFADSSTIELTISEIKTLAEAAAPDWSVVEPHIFGTLFERTLDPAKRSQIGAHYTSSDDIRTLLEPVMLAPLRREWEEVQAKCGSLLTKLATKTKEKIARPTKESKERRDFNRLLLNFVERLAHVTVLDPSCGSGNFLYVALRLLLDLEKEVITFAAGHDLGLLPQVRPTQLHGIEINPFAQELAQVVIWIGYLQWMRDNGFAPPRNPVLEPIESIENRDAIIDLSDPKNPKEASWPAAEFIVGNPPFLGDKVMRRELGDGYVEELRRVYAGRLPGQADLCCYWFERALREIESTKARRVGLLATQNIRGGASREVLKRIVDRASIFFAISDRDWILDGAMVHISMVGFDDGSETHKQIDGIPVTEIPPNLSPVLDTSKSSVLPENASLAFLGSCKGGSFDIPETEAMGLIRPAGNPHGKPNSDVLRPVVNSRELLGYAEQRWIIDNADRSLSEAALYTLPHKLVENRVKPDRDKNRDKWLRENWWRPQRMRPEMRGAIAKLHRFLVTPTTSKHRIFVWLEHPRLPDHKLIVFARDDDYFFGILHSRVHEVWSSIQGTQLRERESGLNYNVQTSFETFPFPSPSDPQRVAISNAARELNDLRNAWLRPPEWLRADILTFPGSDDGPWARYVHDANGQGIGTVRYPRTVPKDDGCANDLRKRTLTNLYNERPAWLDLAHEKLDTVVFAAYGWSETMSDDEVLGKLLELNLSRAMGSNPLQQSTAGPAPKTKKRAKM